MNLGGFAGWVAAYYFWATPLDKVGLGHVAALLIAFLGVTGNLPSVSRQIGLKLPGA